MNNFNLQQKQTNPKGPAIVNFLLVLYMASVLLFTYYSTLNVISQVIFVFAFGGIGTVIFFGGKNFRYDTSILLYTCFVAFCAVGLTWTQSFQESFTMILTLVQLLALYLLLFSYISNYDCIDSLIRGLFISGMICAYVVIEFYGITEYISLMIKGERLGGMISNVNTIGLYMAVTVITGFYYGYIKKINWMYAVTVIPLMVGFGTGSRKCLVMMAFGILFIVFMQYRENINVKSFGKFLAIVCVIIALIWWMTTMPVFQGAFKRILSMLTRGSSQDGSARIRSRMIEVGWAYFKEHPFSGVGIGNSWIINEQAFQWKTYLHNNFVELLACTGVIGFSLYYGIYIYLMTNLYKLSVKTKDSVATLMLTIMVSSLFMDYGAVSYYSKMTYVYFAMAAGAVIIGKRRQKERKENEKNLGAIEESGDQTGAAVSVHN